MFPSFADRTLKCKDCGQPYIFAAAEQEAFASRGLEHPPSRCPTCRATRKAHLAESGASHQASGFGFGGGQGGRRVAREMHSVTCSSCGKPAEVPFVPRGDRPVYCSDCYAQIRSTR